MDTPSMRIAVAIFLLLHGIAHLVGFLGGWELLPSSNAGARSQANVLFGGRVMLGRNATRAVSLLWIVAAVCFVTVAVGIWRGSSWALLALVIAALISLALCIVWWPAARIGAAVNIALLVAFMLASFSAYRNDVRAERVRALSGSRMITTRSGPIEYAELGTGAPILVLHGTGGGWDQGIAGASGVAPYGFRLIAPSRFGYLRTPMPKDASPEAEADTWAAFLDALGTEQVAVMSFSAGTAPAVQFALRHPERVSKLVLFVPAAGGMFPEIAAGPPPFVMKVVLRYDFPMWAVMRLSPKTMLNVVAVPASLVPSLPVEEVATLDRTIRMILPVSARREGMMNDARSQSGTLPLYPLNRISVPTLLISAEDDLYRTLRVARRAADIIPEARLMAFKTGGHLLLGRADEIWPAVASFLTDSAAPDAK